MIEVILFTAFVLINILVNRLYLNDLKGYITYYDINGKMCIDFELLKSGNNVIKKILSRAVPLLVLEVIFLGWFLYELFI